MNQFQKYLRDVFEFSRPFFPSPQHIATYLTRHLPAMVDANDFGEIEFAFDMTRELVRNLKKDYFNSSDSLERWSVFFKYVSMLTPAAASKYTPSSILLDFVTSRASQSTYDYALVKAKQYLKEEFGTDEQL